MEADEDLSASTYTFDSCPSANATPGSGVFTPRGVGYTTLGPPSALSILLAHEESKRSGESLSAERLYSKAGYERASTSGHSISRMSLTPTNERPGPAYFSSAIEDTPRRPGSKSRTGPHLAASRETAQSEFPDQLPDETALLLPADHATHYPEDASNGSQPVCMITKTQPEHAKPVTLSGYGSIAFLSKPAQTLCRIRDPNLGRKAFRALPAVVLGTLLNILDGISCTCSHTPFAPDMRSALTFRVRDPGKSVTHVT